MLGALKFAAGGSHLHIKKRLVEAVIMSRIMYGIQFWGSGSSKTVVRRIQSVQNLAMCWITNSHRLTSTRKMLSQLNWLSVNQLVIYHRFLMIYKIRKKGLPKLNWKQLENGLNTRDRIDLTKRRWPIRIQELYNTVDVSVWNETKISAFKRWIKIWIKKQRHF